MPIKPTSPGSPGSYAEYGAPQGAAATSSSQTPESSLAHKLDAVLHLTPLQIERRSRDRAGDDGARFNADLAALAEQGRQALGSGREPNEGRPASASAVSNSYRRSLSIPDPVRRSRSTPPMFHRDSSGLGTATRVLREERRYKNSMGADLPVATISPHLARILGARSGNETLVNRLAAMKPGSAEIQEGFRPVKLARSFDSLSPDKPAKKQLGSGVYGVAYAVRLSEDFVGNGINRGRDFVFKAMLCTNPDNPIPPRLYTRLPLDHSPGALADEVSGEKARIFKEFQIAASLVHTSRVMQVYGLVQIGDEFGILAERINGETARDLLKKSIEGLRNGVISPQEHLGFTGQVVADVLIGLSRFADEGVTHLDVSPNNVLYDKDARHFKLIDMGKGREAGEAKEMGTRGYIDICTSTADQKNDVYSAGQLLAHFLRDPRQEVGLLGFGGKLSVDDFPFMSELAGLPAEDKGKVIDLVNRMIRIPVTERPTAQEVLRDPFLRNLAPPDKIHECYEKLSQLPDSREAGTTAPRSVGGDGSTPAASSAGTDRM